MEVVGSWCGSGNEDFCCGSRSFATRDYDRFRSPEADVAVVTGGRSRKSPAATAMWTQLWRKSKRDKIKKIFNCSSSRRMGFSYDIYSYAQNFDEDLNWNIDSDEHSRSFSARFAVSSRIFEKNIELVVS